MNIYCIINMKSVLKFNLFIVIILQVFTSGTMAMVEAECEVDKCFCQNIRNIQSKITCKGNGTEALVIGPSLSKGLLLSIRSLVHLKFINYSSVIFQEVFMYEWSTFYKRALDIAHVGRVIFPQMELQKNLSGAFAGIALLNCTLDNLPLGIMQRSKNVGVKVIDSKLHHFNLGSILSDTSALNYLTVSNSAIDILENSASNIILMQNDENNPHILISNSSIGVIDQDALLLHSDSPALLMILDSTIGLLKKDALNISGEISVVITSNKIGILSDSAISVESGIELDIENNTAGIEKNALNSLNCGNDSNVSGNVFMPLGEAQKCTHKLCDERKDKLVDFINPSCLLDNKLLSLNNTVLYLDSKNYGLFYSLSFLPIIILVITIILFLTKFVVGKVRSRKELMRQRELVWPKHDPHPSCDNHYDEVSFSCKIKVTSEDEKVSFNFSSTEMTESKDQAICPIPKDSPSYDKDSTYVTPATGPLNSVPASTDGVYCVPKSPILSLPLPALPDSEDIEDIYIDHED